MSTDTGKRGNGRDRKAEPQELTEEELLEQELAERHRLELCHGILFLQW